MRAKWRGNLTSLAEKRDINLFREMADKANVGIAITDISGELLYTNNAILKIHGYEGEDLLGQHFAIFLGEHQLLRAQQILRQILDEGNIFLQEITSQKKNGESIPVLLNSNVITDSKGEPAFLSATVVDVADKVEAQKALKENEALYRALFDTAPLMLAVTNLQGDILLANKHLMEKTKTSPEQLKQVNMAEVYAETGERQRLLAELKENGKVSNFETSIFDADGDKLLINVNASVFPEMQDTLMVAIKDVTEKKQAEAKLNSMVNELSEANHDMKVFTETVSQGLREPLKYIESYAEIFKDLYGDALDDKGRGFIAKILNSCDRMRTSIEDVLNLSLSIKEEMDIRDQDLSRIIEFQSNNLALCSKDLRAEFTIEAGITAQCDYKLVTLMIDNLLKEISAMIPADEMAVISFRKGREAEYCFESDSLLFSKEEAGMLFAAGSSSASANAGFAIARKVMQRHKGWIRAEVDTKGKKSRILFSFK